MFTERINFSSDKLLLEGIMNYQQDKACEELLILFSPHPKFGGDMENNVLKGIAENLVGAGFITFRFNYRGVGGSETLCPEMSLYDYWEMLDKKNDYQEILQDGLAAAQYARGLTGVRKVFMAGYSFGGKVVEQIVSGTEAEAIAGISLPLKYYDFSKFANLPLKKLLIWGERDFTASALEIEEFRKILKPPEKIALVKDQDHFFRGYESDLSKLIENFLKNND